MTAPSPQSARDRLERQQKTLLDISRRWRWYEADLDKAVAAVIETATVALAVERASVWFFDDEGELLVCHDLYEATPHRHSRRTVLHAKDYPEYFAALKEEDVIAAGDAHRDPRTAAFSDAYLGPLGIGAMIDAPVRLGGRLVGVLCNEHVGGARHFSPDEENTAAYLANLVSLAYEFQRRARDEREAERTHSLLRAAFEASGAGILASDAHGRITVYNQRVLDIWRIPEEVFAQTDRGARIAHVAALARDPAATEQRIRAVMADPECESTDQFELADGRCVEVTSQPQRLDDEVVGRVWSFRDVTYQRSIEKELRELAIRDPLTGLFNRRRAEESLEAELLRARRSKQPFSAAMIDIDDFKEVNDAHGHQVGDDVLRAFADDLRKRLRTTDIACRWGGEEFLLILPHTDRVGALGVLEELRIYLARERRSLPRFTVSAGVAEYDGGKRYDTTIAAADARLYEAKQAGRNQIR